MTARPDGMAAASGSEASQWPSMRTKLREIAEQLMGDPPRRDRRARQMACPHAAGLDGLLCCAAERLSDLYIRASCDRALARCPHALQPAVLINGNPNEDDSLIGTCHSHASCMPGLRSGSLSPSKVGACCLSSARRVLCGGARASNLPPYRDLLSMARKYHGVGSRRGVQSSSSAYGLRNIY